MSKKLDLYLEKIIAKMNLDDAQREGVEREFRAHLEEAVREGVEKGLTEDEAETEAMLAFGQPSVIARQFGITHGYGWFVFERICFSFVIYLILSLFSKNRIFGIIISILFLARYLWNKIEINGTLRIRRIFRKTINIPFERIKRVTFEKGHLWGTRRIMLFYSEKKASLSPRLRNFRCAALALDVLCPDALESGVREFFKRISLRVPRERKWVRHALTVYWLMILILYSISLSGLLRVERISPLVLISWILFLSGIIFQAIYINNKSQKGISWFLLFIFIFYLTNTVVLVLSYRSEYIRWLSPGFSLITICALLSLIWKGKRIHLVILVLFTLLLLIPIKFILPPTKWEGEINYLLKDKNYPVSLSQIHWKDNGSLCFLLSSNDRYDFLNMEDQMIKEAPFKDIGKEKGYWWITGKNTSKDLTLIYAPSRNNVQSWKDNPGAFYLYSPEEEMGVRRHNECNEINIIIIL
ncbi:hypothetical protein JW926_11775 [Candidatus Sumerlaeota bacterium]|nr:hypothetical protein [Candidatus Sumerlaeota bacterium]